MAKTPRPLLSACLIVRDEEANLPRCLASLAPAVDEVVVVDTGSTDRTVAIARRQGARVSHFSWVNDFAAARNESIRHVRGGWFIWIDADEELSESSPGALRELCRALGDEPVGLLLELRNLDFAGAVESGAVQRRVVPTRRRAHFEGRVHEQLVLPSGVWRPVKGVAILHHGYASQDVLDRKFERNRDLLLRAIAEQPGEPAHHYDLGRLLLYGRWQQFEAALQHLQAAVDLWKSYGRPPVPYLAELFGFAAWAAIVCRHPEQALALDPPQDAAGPGYLHYTGLALLQMGRPDEAAARLRASLAAPPPAEGVRDDSLRPRTLVALAEIACDLGDAAEGTDWARQAHALAPADPECLFVLALAASKRGDADDALTWARQAAATGEGHWQAQARRIIFDVALQRQDAKLQIEALTGDVAGISPEDALRLLAHLTSSLMA